MARRSRSVALPSRSQAPLATQGNPTSSKDATSLVVTGLFIVTEGVRDALCILNWVPNGDVAHLAQATTSAQISPPAKASNDKSGGDAARVLGLDGADVVDDVRDQDRPRRRRSMRASSKPTALAAASTVAPCPIRCSARSTRSTCW
jgi:hypothetical protein